MKKIQIDMHTHTLASGHAYATLTEMAREASERGLKILGIAEHDKHIPGACDELYFKNMKVVPRSMFGIELMLGAEINILDYSGTLGLDEKYMQYLDIRIAGVHDCCYTTGSIDENTEAIVNVIKNPAVDIISHPDDGNCPLDYERVVEAAVKHHTLLEINNNSLRNPSRKDVEKNILNMLAWCKHYKQPVILGSDAHYTVDVANVELAESVIAKAAFPHELVINYSAEDFKAYIQRNRQASKVNCAVREI